ncbi:MAG: hypothetical protein WBD16_09565 [Pyrinomonadaceae bacterium]
MRVAQVRVAQARKRRLTPQSAYGLLTIKQPLISDYAIDDLLKK